MDFKQDNSGYLIIFWQNNIINCIYFERSFKGLVLYKRMTRFLLAIFLIIFGCKLIAENTSFYKSVTSKVGQLSEEIEMEHDDQEDSKQEQDDTFYPSCFIFTAKLNELILQNSLYNYVKPCSGFTDQTFSPPDFI
jgi:hypothetical protein